MHKIETLQKTLVQLGVKVTDAQLQKSLDYLDILKKWNTIHNLTRIEPGKQLDLHIIDSLSVYALCQGEFILDVGSGAGLPGIPLSIFWPEKKFYLLDSNQKKSIFIKYAAKKLDLPNVVSVNSRVQDYQPEQKFQTILSRAFASTNKFVRSCSHLLVKDGKLIAMKGQLADIEKDIVPTGFLVEACLPLRVPKVESRHAVIISRQK